MANSFDLFNRVKVANPSANVDYYYGTYESVEAACLGVPSSVRMLGKTVGIIVNGSVVEYWWQSGLEDWDLVEKSSGGGGSTADDKYNGIFDNQAGGTSVTVPAAVHKCGRELIVQCKVDGSVVNIDTSVDASGNVVISWGNAGLISAQHPLTINIMGVRVNKQPVPTTSPVTITMNLRSFYDNSLIAVLEQDFMPGERITLESFDDWANYSDKYDLNEWYVVVDTAGEFTSTVKGKEYVFNYHLSVMLPDSSTDEVNGIVEHTRYGVPVSLNDIKYSYLGEEYDAQEWSQTQGAAGELNTIEMLFTMNDEYSDEVTLAGVLEIS